MTLTFDLSSWKWCTTHRPLMCCMYAIYEVIRSNKQETTDITKFKWIIWPWPWSFWSGNGAQHIVTSWVVRVSHMKWISEIGTELQSGHGKKIGTTFDLWSWIWCATPRHLMCCMYATYEVIQPNKDGVMGRTRQKNQTDLLFKWPVWPWPFDLEMDRDTLSRYGLYFCQVKIDRSNRHGAKVWTRQKFRMNPVTLSFDLFTWNHACHKHFIRSMSGVNFMKVQL